MESLPLSFESIKIDSPPADFVIRQLQFMVLGSTDYAAGKYFEGHIKGLSQEVFFVINHAFAFFP